MSPQDSASVDTKENDLIASPWCVGWSNASAGNPVLRGVTFLTETVPGSNPLVVVPAADIALWDLSLGETADVYRPLHARVPLRCRASRHEMGTREGIQ